MASDPNTERLRSLIAKITYLTTKGEIQWERQADSAHRYARWNNNLLILGPDVSTTDHTTARYLFITPFDSPDCIEISSDRADLGAGVLALVGAVESATIQKPQSDPFRISPELIDRLTQ
ncbi:MAG TPA: hypothetical protein VJ372_10405 [Pyrinomonadaceae bacterium]|jgi:hypothetical protein|nr:hypothetical protein [Pyrinomonadaceae bacterium]